MKFLRFLSERGYNVKKELVEEFEKHLECLFSGIGGYDFPLYYDEVLKKEVYDTSLCSKIIEEYAKTNEFSLGIVKERRKLIEECRNVKKIVIMG